MYTLRIIEETRKSKDDPFRQMVHNHCLGDAYTVRRKGVSPDFAEAVMKAIGGDTEYTELIVTGSNGDTFVKYRSHEYDKFTYFIMTENGKTFERL
jgi:hypothetical protein